MPGYAGSARRVPVAPVQHTAAPAMDEQDTYYEGKEVDTHGKLKFTMPKFAGENDPEVYLSWELKVERIFRLHHYT